MSSSSSRTSKSQYQNFSADEKRLHKSRTILLNTSIASGNSHKEKIEIEKIMHLFPMEDKLRVFTKYHEIMLAKWQAQHQIDR